MARITEILEFSPFSLRVETAAELEALVLALGRMGPHDFSKRDTTRPLNNALPFADVPTDDVKKAGFALYGLLNDHQAVYTGKSEGL